MLALGRDIAMFKPVINAAIKGDPDAVLVVEFAEEDQADNLLRLKQLGAVRSMEFVGVDANGQDEYRVVHSGGTTEEWSIQLDSHGVIDGAMSQGPYEAPLVLHRQAGEKAS